MNHLDRLISEYPLLPEGPVLDLGCGSGKFLMMCKKRNIPVSGIDISPERIERLSSEGYDVVLGFAEHLPYDTGTFRFVNMSEVIEHVQEPDTVMQEVARVMKDDGAAYVSVPNRWGVYDPHYHMWFINWMPRSWADYIIRLLGKDKTGALDNQKLSAMHYFTPSQFIRYARSFGFSVKDTRTSRIPSILLPVYLLLQPIMFQTNHFMLQKQSIKNLD